METTFMTIHNLSQDATILFASDSIADILGYQPDEVKGRSCFEYFHPDEVPLAQHIHNRSLQLDKAAVLHYARIRGRDGHWVGCECVFTVVYDVLVACTSIYKGDEKSEMRAAQAPAIRRIFASSPRDPRYHMLEYLSSKFRTPAPTTPLEPRAAIMVNRFSEFLTVMYATTTIESILGVTPEQFKNKSFYECIQEECIPEAVRCLQSAKANDSIAYLRFKYRDPRRPEDMDEEIGEASQSSDSEEGGVQLHGYADGSGRATGENTVSHRVNDNTPGGEGVQARQDIPRTLSGESSNLGQDSAQAMFDSVQQSESSSSSLIMSTPGQGRTEVNRAQRPAPESEPEEPIELEAVVSCTSDGLVVILRRARPLPPLPQEAIQPHIGNGIFAAPWGVNPVRPHQYQPDRQHPFQHGFGAPQAPVGGPPPDIFMQSIREVAVFAWSLTGINGNIASYSHGMPRGEAQPPDGLPVWDPYAQPQLKYMSPENQAAQRWANWRPRTNEGRDGNIVPPFQHPRQAELHRQIHGYDHGQMGHPRASGFNHYGDHGRRFLAPGNHQQNGFNQHGYGQGQEGWAVGPPGGHNTPSTEPQGTRNANGNGHLWH